MKSSIAALSILILLAGLALAIGNKPSPIPEEIRPQEIENIVGTLLNADKVFIRKPMAIEDLDNDGKKELVVFGFVSAPERPAGAGGKAGYKKDGNTMSSDLMVLARDGAGKYYFKGYYINAFPRQSSPKILLKDIAGKGDKAVLLSSRDINTESKFQSFLIYAFANGKLVPVTFRGGHFSDKGMPTFPAAGRLTVTFSGASDTYAWNQQGYFELVSTTVRSPAEEEQRVIDHLIANITGMVKDKPILGSTSFGIYRFCFYPDKRVLVNYEDGHYERVFLGKYQIKGDKVKITCLDENARNSDAFMAKHKLTSAGAKEYFFNKGVYIGR